MFLRCKTRKKDGKTHRYWSVVESCRTRGGKIVQRHVLYLGEINDAQRAAWCKTIEVVEAGRVAARQIARHPNWTAPWCKCAWSGCVLSARASGGRAGSPWSCGGGCNWMSSGHRGCPPAARAPLGSTCSRRWSSIG
jgi:hypothetical protein